MQKSPIKSKEVMEISPEKQKEISLNLLTDDEFF